MDEKELALEMLNYLNETSQYLEFLSWAEDRGHDVEQLEEDIEKLEEF